MSVEKFRSGAEMNAAPVVVASGSEAFERFLRHCARHRKLARPVYPRGVFKFRSIGEMQAFSSSANVRSDVPPD